LIAALGLAAILGAMIIFDGESTYVEGLALIGLYVIIAASVWFGPPIPTTKKAAPVPAQGGPARSR
jgi:hypothetical protein